MKSIKVALLQQIKTENIKQNITHVIKAIQDAKLQGAELIVLPELFCFPYFCQTENPEYFNLSESIPGPLVNQFSLLAKDLQVVIILPIFEKRAKGIYHNTVVVLDKDGRQAGIYRKNHIPDDPGFYEKYYFTPGDLGFKPIKTSLGSLGVLICWDQWFPEAARLMALNGADCLIYPTAIGWDPADTEDEKIRQLDSWITIQRSHAIANGLPVISVNRTGFEKPGIEFWGNSFASGPQGDILCNASANIEESLIVNISFEKTEGVRRIWPFLRDRRIDAYEDLNKRFVDHAKDID